MAVSSLDSGTVKDEEDEQQTKAAFKSRAVDMDCFR